MSAENGALRGSVSVLEGYGVRLTPIEPGDAAALAAAAASCPADAFPWTFVPRTETEWLNTIAWYLSDRFIFTVCVGSDIVGTTGFYDLDFFNGRDVPDACEVGHTWYVPALRGTTVNPACKLLLFTHAFEEWEVGRIAMRTDARNRASRAAMLKLGMTFEGVRRRHMPGADGTIRDSAYFSAVAEEWPAIKLRLLGRLSRD